MIDDSVSTPQITEYLRSLLKPNSVFLTKLEQQAKDEYIPVIQPEVVQLIRVIFKMSKVKTVLEVGAAIGYSAIIFGGAIPPEGKVVTIELKPDLVQAALDNIKKAELQDRIKVLQGDAIDVMDRLDEKFDCIFLDGAKGQYVKFLPKCLRLLQSGGILISDNILYRGTVAEQGFIPRKHRTIIRNLKEYLELISNHEQLETTILPIGDGVAISYKNEY